MTKEVNIRWAEIILIPLIVGFALVYANMTMILFKVIGWILFIFGILSGSVYLFKLYKIHQEKIKKYKEEFFKIFKKKKVKEKPKMARDMSDRELLYWSLHYKNEAQKKALVKESKRRIKKLEDEKGVKE